MNEGEIAYHKDAIKPWECIKEGWNLIDAQYWLFVLIVTLGMVISLAPWGLLVGPMTCGIYFCLLASLNQQKVAGKMLFQGFNFFYSSLIATIIYSLPISIVTLPVGFSFQSRLEALERSLQAQVGVGQLTSVQIHEIMVLSSTMFGFFLLRSTVTQFLGMFAYPLIVEYQLNAWSAVKLSFKAAFDNMFGLLGLIMLTTIISFLSFFCCGIGLLFTMPLVYAAWTVAYRQVFPPPKNVPTGDTEEEDLNNSN